jgi:hypothetical protein
MSTTIRATLSKKNPYWIEKHRYYELKHFCLQYPIWKKEYLSFDGFSKINMGSSIFSVKGTYGDPTAKCAITREYYLERMKMLEKVAELTDNVIGKYILRGVTEGWSYDILKVRLEIPCCKDIYYELYRKFFWILDKERE